MDPAKLATLLAPISLPRPGGTDLGYSPEFDEVRRLREGEDATLAQGEWIRELQSPQWPRVREVCETLLETRTKDLQVACWYLEALSRLEGFPGLSFGLEVLEGLLVRYWEADPPALFPAEPEERIARLEWLNDGRRMTTMIGGIPMTSPETGGLSWLRWEESRLVENLGLRDPKARQEAVSEGKLAGEAWDKAAQASGQGFYLRLLEQVQHAQARLGAFRQRLDQCLAGDAPSLAPMSEALEGCAALASRMSMRVNPGTREKDLRPEAVAPDREADAPPVPGTISSRREAIRRLREVAAYYRDHEPHSPVGPLVERAARWGEMPLGQWLVRVIKDENTLGLLQELLDLRPES
ncbi:MAG TPA: type VI secretion system protein TssA [Holophaga sp.]|nr:type VI secretion system protein TssA [Holophaga sp.]HPS66325.1 type VI secretion system protein TssA [Holophaga sp.]